MIANLFTAVMIANLFTAVVICERLSLIFSSFIVICGCLCVLQGFLENRCNESAMKLSIYIGISDL